MNVLDTSWTTGAGNLLCAVSSSMYEYMYVYIKWGVDSMSNQMYAFFMYQVLEEAQITHFLSKVP